ncbi:MAG: amidase family protein [Bacteroidota bacterium]
MKEFGAYDAIGLAELVSKKEISAVELVNEAIERIEQFNPKINAVIHKMYDVAHEQAVKGSHTGTFGGVPFLLKDLLSTYGGAPFSKGCKALKSYIANEDSETVKRFKKSGLVTLGKTNTPEFGLMGVTEPEAFGPTRSPWNTNHTPGGSSGGSAAAVAAGIVPMASAGDGGGSIRIPASCSGIFGLKPSRGRVPTAPAGEMWQGASVEHVLTRSVRDSAAMLDILNGSVAGAPYHIAQPVQSYSEVIKTTPRTLKVAFTTQSPLGNEVDPACKEAVAHAAKLLSDLGHHVEEKQPEYDGMEVAMAYLIMYFGEIAAEIEDLEPMLGRKVKRSDVESTTWTLGLLGRTFTAAEFVKSKLKWNDFARMMGRFHQTYDLYLTPTIAVKPPEIGATQPSKAEQMTVNIINALGWGKLLRASGVVNQIAEKSLGMMPFTQLANLTGQPAMSVPLYWSEDNLPIGVQFIAPSGDEATLLSLAAQLEQAQPWFDKRPAL